MATETLELKTPEADFLPKVEDGVTDSEIKESPVSDDKGEEDDGEIDEEKTGKSPVKEPVTPVSERHSRQRKKVERYSLDTPSRSASKPVSIQQGRGTQLKEIPNVAYKLSKRKPDDNLFLLHTILYGRKGKTQMLKRNIGQFSGFVWSEQEEEKQRAKAKEKLEKCIKEKLIDFCDVLDIPINKSSVKKEELAVRVLEFLICPKATREIVLGGSEKTKKRKKSTLKNVTSGESSDVPAKRRRQTKKSGNKQDQPSETEEGNDEGDVGSEGTNESHGEDDAAPEKENDENEDTETEDEKEKAKEKKAADKKRKEKPAPEEEKTIKGSAKSGRKSSKQVDKSTSSSSKKQTVEKDDSSKDKGKKQTSKPQAKGSKDQGKAIKKGKTEPTRKQLHVVVGKILKEVDFNTATLSDILRKLGSHFGIDLMHRKTEVKDIITDAINEMSDDDEREETTEDEDEDQGEKEDKERKD